MKDEIIFGVAAFAALVCYLMIIVGAYMIHDGLGIVVTGVTLGWVCIKVMDAYG